MHFAGFRGAGMSQEHFLSESGSSLEPLCGSRIVNHLNITHSARPLTQRATHLKSLLHFCEK